MTVFHAITIMYNDCRTVMQKDYLDDFITKESDVVSISRYYAN